MKQSLLLLFRVAFVLGCIRCVDSVSAVAQVPTPGHGSIQTSYQKYLTSQGSPILRAEASPTLIFVGSPARVTVTAQVAGAKSAPHQVVLYRVSNGEKRAIAELRPMGNNSTYSGQIILSESRTAVVVLQVEASYQQDAAIYATNFQRSTYDSNLISVNVLPETQKGGSQGPTQSGGSNPVSGNNSGGTAWGSFGGALAGSLAGAVVGKLFESRQSPGHGEQSPQNQPSAQYQQSESAAQPVTQSQPSELQPQPSQPHDPPTQEHAVSAGRLTIRYPNGWSDNPHILQIGGPIALRNFSDYLRGGIIPDGGAEIEIAQAPQGSRALGDTVRFELGADGAPQMIDGQSALRAFYVDEFSPGLTYENVAVYVSHGDLLYKFFLSYRAGDPQKGKYIGSFDQVLASARFQ